MMVGRSAGRSGGDPQHISLSPIAAFTSPDRMWDRPAALHVTSPSGWSPARAVAPGHAGRVPRGSGRSGPLPYVLEAALLKMVDGMGDVPHDCKSNSSASRSDVFSRMPKSTNRWSMYSTHCDGDHDGNCRQMPMRESSAPPRV